MRIKSDLLATGRLAVEITFPYGDPGSSGANWNKPDAHRTALWRAGAQCAEFTRELDGDHYTVKLAWNAAAELREAKKHTFILAPEKHSTVLELVCEFLPRPEVRSLPDFSSVKMAAAEHWPKFWNSGGAIDLSASQDPRWQELERRIVLSQ